jgi:hypothetical protein
MKGERCTDAEFRHMVDHLRAVCPPPKGCSVEAHRVPQAKLGDCAGTCAKEGRRFTINIRHESTQQETEETLIHEWAHMMDWRPYHPLSGDHGPTWGVWYASVFSSYCGVK